MGLFNYKIEAYENGVWAPLKYWVRPFHDTATLDESLDSGNFKLSCVLRQQMIKPFTPLRYTIKEFIDKEQEAADTPVEERIFYRLVTDCQKVKRTFQNDLPARYDYLVRTIEYTKILERSVCDSITFTNYLSRDFPLGAVITAPEEELSWGAATTYGSGNWQYSPQMASGSQIILPAPVNFITLPPAGIGESHSFVDDNIITVTRPDGSIYSTSDLNQTGNITFNQTGSYNIKYSGRYRKTYAGGYQPDYYNYSYIWTIGVIEPYENIEQKPFWTIRSVVERILSAGITRRQGIDVQKYLLDPVQAAELDETPAPEFHITRSTLFEALLQVGGYIHAIPRLEFPTDQQAAQGIEGIVKFDFLGGDNEFNLNSNIVAAVESYTGDEYCGAIDSTVENLINTMSPDEGTSEPFKSGFIAPRTDESRVEISNDTALILTNSPIYRLIKLYVKYNGVTKDITQYVYEAAEYNALSSYTGSAFPYSKAYALRYAQGDNKITALQFKLIKATAVGEFGNRTAIQGIIKREYNIDIGGIDQDDYTDLHFQIEYIPSISARLVQKRPYTTHPLDNTLLYNQGANMVESSFYGEQIKGAIARLGNSTLVLTCDFKHLENIPSIGDMVRFSRADGTYNKYYCAVISYEYERKYIRATLTMTPNFNKLAEFLGLNSNFRLYDVSEKQSIGRYINYGECVLIGDYVTLPEGVTNQCSIQSEGIYGFAFTFRQHLAVGRASYAVVQGVAKTGALLTRCLLPCQTAAIGNSLAFIFHYKDNYGAGYQANSLPNPEDIKKKVQHLVPYGDAYGELEQLRVTIGNNFEDVALPPDYSFKLPEYTGTVPQSKQLVRMESKPLIVQKDSRETLNVTYQMHLTSNRDSIVLGSLLTRNNLLIRNETTTAPKVFLSTKPINMLRSKLDLSAGTIFANDITSYITIRIYPDTKMVHIDNNDFFYDLDTSNYKAWAIVDPETGEYYIGENFEPGEKPRDIFFNFLDNNALREVLK